MPPQNGKLKLRDIARLTGHTVGTVSKALHDKPGLAPKTREYILKVARESGYIGNALAGSLRSGTTKTAAIILGDIANPLFAIMAKGLIAALAQVGYSAILLNSEENNEEEVRAVTTALSRNVPYTSKEARYGAFRGCCSVHGGFKTQRLLRSRNFTRGRLLTTDENHYLHLTDLGQEVAEKIYERHCFLTKLNVKLETVTFGAFASGL